jgi:hypothetical protein
MGDYRYRWVRVRTPGANPVIAYQNVDRAIADGWEPVGAGDWPEGMPLALVEGRADHVLYRLPEEQALARRVPIDQFNAEAVAKIREQFLRDDPYKAKFAFYPGHEDPNHRIRFKPPDTAETFYSPANLVAHPDRAEELEAYKKHVAEHGERFSRERLGLPPK